MGNTKIEAESGLITGAVGCVLLSPRLGMGGFLSKHKLEADIGLVVKGYRVEAVVKTATPINLDIYVSNLSVGCEVRQTVFSRRGVVDIASVVSGTLIAQGQNNISDNRLKGRPYSGGTKAQIA